MSFVFGMVIILLKISYKVLTLLTSVLPVERHTLENPPDTLSPSLSLCTCGSGTYGPRLFGRKMRLNGRSEQSR